MWTVIYMAQSKEAVFEIEQLLRDAHILVRIRKVGDEERDDYYDIYVPSTEADQAHTVLIENEY
jgi:hypothetical protein